tara:strand:+ start:1865 stop:4291 length:2427 start_codon:yes stop_codon:yes gene_type:complete
MSEQFFIKESSFPSIYLGIIIQNNDPSRKGRVKVYIPEITPTIYKGWNDVRDRNLKFKFFGKNIDSDITPILNDLKKILPWSPCVMPIIGDNAPGHFDATDENASISDASGWTIEEAEELRLKQLNEEDSELNVDGVGESPAHILERQSTRQSDGLHNPQVIGGITPNHRGGSYIPSSHSNRSKGSFSIPSVGSHVWVQFRNSNPQFPIIIGTALGAKDYEELYECYGVDIETDTRARQQGIDYPGWMDNKKGSREDSKEHEDITFRSKWVLNQRGGAIEITNTENRERIKFTHWSGSFMEFTTNCIVNLAVKDRQDLIKGNFWSTVNGNNEHLTVGNYSNVVAIGDRYTKTGVLTEGELFVAWKDIVAPLQGAKALFHLKRTDSQPVVPLNVSYDLLYQQEAKGYLRKHPTLNFKNENIFNKLDLLERTTPPVVAFNVDEVLSYDNVTAPGTENSEPIERDALIEEEGPTVLANDIDINWPASTSTQGGQWSPETVKDKIKDIRVETQKKLTTLEGSMLAGGDELDLVTRNSTNIVGGAFNDFPSVRIDPVGREYINSTVQGPRGPITNYIAGPHIEPISVEKMPCGTKTDVIGDQWNVNIGANGFNINSIGVSSISSPILNLAGNEINLSANSNMHLGARHVQIFGDTVELKSNGNRQVNVSGSLGVSTNQVIGGSLAVNGELYCQHITAPVEIQQTEETTLVGKMNTTRDRELVIGEVKHTTSLGVVEWLPVYAKADDNLIVNYPHSHHFINVPLRPMNSNDDVRIIAINEGINSNVNSNIVDAQPTNHGLKSWNSKAVLTPFND